MAVAAPLADGRELPGAIALELAILFERSSVTSATATVYRCVYALPALVALGWNEHGGQLVIAHAAARFRVSSP